MNLTRWHHSLIECANVSWGQRCVNEWWSLVSITMFPWGLQTVRLSGKSKFWGWTLSLSLLCCEFMPALAVALHHLYKWGWWINVPFSRLQVKKKKSFYMSISGARNKLFLHLQNILNPHRMILHVQINHLQSCKCLSGRFQPGSLVLVCAPLTWSICRKHHINQCFRRNCQELRSSSPQLEGKAGSLSLLFI